jgi:hypothetical protein
VEVHTINLICLETNKCLRSFTSMAIGLCEKQEAQWYQTMKNIKVEWLE